MKSKSFILFGVFVLALALGVFYFSQDSKINSNDLGNDKLETKRFSTEEELINYIKETSNSEGVDSPMVTFAREESVQALGSDAGASISADKSSSSEYSTTNVQIEGVDEADFMKNDGEYIYLVSGETLYIVDANPAEEMYVVSETKLESYVSQMYLNGNKLIIFGYSSEYYPLAEDEGSDSDSSGSEEVIETEVGAEKRMAVDSLIYNPGYYQDKSVVWIYDVSDKENPELNEEIEVEGNYVDSRMIGDYIYLVSTKYIYLDNFAVPRYWIDGVESSVKVQEIYYPGNPSSSYVFTSVSSIGLEDESFETETYLLGSTSTIFVSTDNIYITQPKEPDYEKYSELVVDEVYKPMLPPRYQEKVDEILADEDTYSWRKVQELDELMQDYLNGLKPESLAKIVDELEERFSKVSLEVSKLQGTEIHKISVDEGDINYESSGSVPGYVLNQFSMDEYGGNLRIATTTGGWNWFWSGRNGQETLNHLYILNEDLEVIGSVEDLASGETIYSARFMGGKAYMVTYRQVDPLFVIDVENPEEPEILGYLKISGYSNYLHPYDENHLIGIGQETEVLEGDRAINTGLKISLFDVSDFENPREVDKLEIGDRGTSSPAQYDHKALLFDKEKNLLVIPVDYYEEQKGLDYGSQNWAGVYVISIDEESLDVRGKISHTKKGEDDKPEDYPSQYFYYNYYEDQIRRSLYIGDVLYTISDYRIKANNLETLEEQSEIEYREKQNYYWYGYGSPVMVKSDSAVL